MRLRPFSLGRISAAVIIFLFVGHLLGRVGPDYILSLLLLPILVWFHLYTLSCEKKKTKKPKTSASLQVILTNSCNFDVPMGGANCGVLLLHHLTFHLSFNVLTKALKLLWTRLF